MNGFLTAIGKFVGVIDLTPVVNLHGIDDLKKENPDLEAKRLEAKARMASFGRKSMLEGGEFSRNNRCLMKPQKELRI